MLLAGRLVKTDMPFKYSKLRRAAAMLAAFFVSGFMHEVMIW